MNENIHNDDEFFRKAYDNFEEEPSPEVWEKLNAQLDKKDAMFYRNRSVVWKRSALGLLLLLIFFVSYEYGFKEKEKSGSDIANNATQNKTNKSSETTNSKPSGDISTVPSIHQTDEASSSSASPKHKNENDSAASQSFAEANKDQLAEQKQEEAVDLSANKKNDKVVEQPVAALITEHKNKRSISIKKDELYSSRIYQAFTQRNNKESKSASNFYYKPNNSFEYNSGNTTISQEIASANKTEKDNTTISATDSSRFAVDAASGQVTNVEKDKAASNENKVDSNATASVATEKKTAIKINNLFKPHWSFSPYAAVDFSGQLLNDDDRFSEPGGRNDRHELEERESEQFGYSLGILSRYQFSRKWLAKTGLILSNQSTQIDPQTLYASSNVQDVKFKYVTSSGYAYFDPSFNPSPAIGDSITSQRAVQHLTYLNIPLQLSYLIHAGKKLSLLPGIGFTTNLLLNSKITTEVKGDDDDDKDNVSIRGIKGLDKINFSILADAELQYQFSRKWSFMMLPSFKYAVNPITKEHVVKTYPYSFGLGFGVTYGL